MLYVSIIVFSALLYTYYHFRDRVPILMYHRIASVPGRCGSRRRSGSLPAQKRCN